MDFGFCVVTGLLAESILTISCPVFFACVIGSSKVTFFKASFLFFLVKNLIILSPAFSPTCSPVL